MKSLFILIPMVFLPCAVFSQLLFGTSGGTISDPNHQFDFSIGEAIVADFSSSDNIMNVGFQQPYYDFFTASDPIKESYFHVYPNPFSTRFKFDADQAISSYILFDALGKSVKTEKVGSSSFIFDKYDLPKGFYTLQVLFHNQTTKIVNLIHQ
jgi:hypothetical protein